ncbi:hypothetical protein LSAT2_006565, partial [Lamellibrachia satsuma]
DVVDDDGGGDGDDDYDDEDDGDEDNDNDDDDINRFCYCFVINKERALATSSSASTFKRRQFGDPVSYCLKRFCSGDLNRDKYYSCISRKCPNAAVVEYGRDLNEIMVPVIAANPARGSRSQATSICARFLCGNLQLPVGAPCVQLACRWRPLEVEPLNQDANQRTVRATLSTTCRRLLCSDYDNRRTMLGNNRSKMVVAKRNINAGLAQCISSRCGRFRSTDRGGVWRRLSCITRWCHRFAL